MKNEKTKQIQPRRLYTKYVVNKKTRHYYEIELTYFIYRGNVLKDSDVQYTKTKLCPVSEFKDFKRILDNRICVTERYFSAEFGRIGANKLTSTFVMKGKTH